MSTPTTVKFQIEVLTDENGEEVKKLFLVDMSVESECGAMTGYDLVPCGEVPPPQDPPRPAIEISLAA